MPVLEPMKLSDFRKASSEHIKENLQSAPKLLTADGEGVCIVMLVEDYYAHIQSLPGGRMVRIEGVLYREVK